MHHLFKNLFAGCYVTIGRHVLEITKYTQEVVIASYFIRILKRHYNSLLSRKLINIIYNIIYIMRWEIYVLSIENFCNEKGMIKVLEGIFTVNCFLQTMAILFHS